MGDQRILGHLLFGDLSGQPAVHPASDIEFGQLLVLEDGITPQFLGFACKVSLFGIGLRTDLDVFASRH